MLAKGTDIHSVFCNAGEETDPEYVVGVAVGGSDSASFLDDDDYDMTDNEDSDEDTEVQISFISNGKQLCSQNHPHPIAGRRGYA